MIGVPKINEVVDLYKDAVGTPDVAFDSASIASGIDDAALLAAAAKWFNESFEVIVWDQHSAVQLPNRSMSAQEFKGWAKAGSWWAGGAIIMQNSITGTTIKIIGVDYDSADRSITPARAVQIVGELTDKIINQKFEELLTAAIIDAYLGQVL